MKINSPLPSVGNASSAQRSRGPGAVSPQPESAGTERVDISSLSARLQGVGSGEAPVDAKRVADIKQAISEGRFQINPERIADGLLTSVRDMLGRSAKTE